MKPVSFTGPMIASLILAAIFQLLPASGEWILWKPNFLLLMTLAWILYVPTQYGIGFAATVGLVADTLFRTTLGHYVLVFALCGAAAYLLSRWLTYFSIFHRIFLILVLVICAELLQNMLFAIWDVPMTLGHLPALALTSALAWPLIDLWVARVHLHHR
jgi:rod shape-determining protein MreD